MNISIFKNEKLSFVELRYIKEITSCEKKHLHDELTITAIKEGVLTINFKESNLTLDANGTLIINSLISHSANLDRICKDGYVLYLKKEYLEKNSLYFSKAYDILQGVDFIEVCEILLDDKFTLLEKEESLLEFCIKTFIYIKTKEEQKSDLSIKIKEYLDKNYLEDLILEDIAESFNITVTHLIRVFKKDFELPIHSYILNKRVHKAKELLSLSSMPINEIALECGFFDLAHLNRNFKKVFQVTAKQFQKDIKC